MKLSSLCNKLCYITLGVLGCLLSTKIFDEHIFLRDFYVYYTNLTNYLCLGVMIFCFVKEYKIVKSKINGNAAPPINYSSEHPFAGMQVQIHDYNTSSTRTSKLTSTIFTSAILIFVTFVVYNMWLADYSLNNYFFSLYNMLFHVVLPIWFIIFALSLTPKISLFTPIYAFIVQSVYILFVFVRSLIIKGAPARIIYPYFFLNFETLGFWGSIKWLAYMFVLTCACGYGLILINKLIWMIKSRKNLNKNLQKK